MSPEPAASRFPLPAVLAAMVLVGVVHWPLVSTPALFQEGPLIRGEMEIESSLPGATWLETEIRWFGPSLISYRWIPFLFELFTIVAVARWVSWRGSHGGLAALLAAAYLLHPARTETVVFLGLRSVWFSELMLGIGVFLCSPSARRVPWLVGSVFLGIGAFGLPAVVAAALPLGLLLGGTRAWWPAAGLLLGSVANFVGESAPFLPRLASIQAAEMVLAPWNVGLLHPVVGSWEGLWLLGLLGGLTMLAAPRWRRASLWTAVATVLATASVTRWRAPRLDLGLPETSLTPENLLPAVAMGLSLLFLVGRGSRWRQALVLVVALGAMVPGALRVRHFQSERELLDHALTVHEESPYLWVQNGQALLREPRPISDSAPEALESADRALQLDSELIAARELRSLSLVLLGEYDKACRESDVLLAERPDDAEPRRIRGRIESIAGQDFESVRWFREAAELDRQGPRTELFVAMERCYARIEESLQTATPEETRRWCERLLEVAPNDPRAREVRAHTYAAEGNLDRAVKEFEELREQAADPSLALRALIPLLERIGDQDRAREYRRQLQEWMSPVTR